jgi:DNA-binding Lrp family transcriptional regulator
MATRAYVLIVAELGQVKSVAEAVRTIPGVTMADIVAGTYDLVAVIEAQDSTALGHLVLERIRPLPGITTTLTLIAMG